MKSALFKPTLHLEMQKLELKKSKQQLVSAKVKGVHMCNHFTAVHL